MQTLITLGRNIALRLDKTTLGNGSGLPFFLDTFCKLFGFFYRYRQVPDSKQDEGANTTGPVEMVTVPALGPEWKTSEMQEMTKSAKRQRKREAIQSRLKSWNRDEEGFCGGFLTRKTLVFGLFGVCIV